MGIWTRVRESLAHAFSTDDGQTSFSEKDIEIIEKIAKVIVKRGMATPAILFLEGFKPLNFIGSQVMVFLRPYVEMVMKNTVDYNSAVAILEKRGAIEKLIEVMIEMNSEGKSKGSEKGDVT